MRVRYLGNTTLSRQLKKMLSGFPTVRLKTGNVTSSQQVSLAKTSPQVDPKQGCQEKNQACSLRSFAWLDRSGPEAYCWRTWQRCLIEEWTRYSGRFPKSGTMLNGTLYHANPLVDLTSDPECLSWPTPAAHEARLGYQKRHRGAKGIQESLTTVVINRLGGREAVTGQLNPMWVSWLMGFETGHVNLDASETQ